MTIEYNVSEQDYLNFNLFHLNNSKQMKNTKLALKYGTVILCLVLLLVLFWGQIAAQIAGGVVIIIWIAVFSKFWDYLAKQTVKKQINEGKANDFIGPQKLTLKDDCIEEVSINSTTTVQYTAVERIEYGYECIFVYVGAIAAYIIPNSAFTDTEQRNKFTSILKEKTGIA